MVHAGVGGISLLQPTCVDHAKACIGGWPLITETPASVWMGADLFSQRMSSVLSAGMMRGRSMLSASALPATPCRQVVCGFTIAPTCSRPSIRQPPSVQVSVDGEEGGGEPPLRPVAARSPFGPSGVDA